MTVEPAPMCTTTQSHDGRSRRVDATMVPAGKHTLTVTIDGAATSCSFQLPESRTSSMIPVRLDSA